MRLRSYVSTDVRNLKRRLSLPISCKSGMDSAADVAIATIVSTGFTSVGQSIRYPKTESPEIQMLRVSIPSGMETGWHLHPVPGCIYVLSGALTVYTKERQREYQAGDGFIEVIGIAHNGINLGETPVELLMIFIGIRDQESTIEVSFN
jgi:quercetin dioxygenase-like cupin family protein